MKIVQITPRYPPNTGGVETHVKEISEQLVERGQEVTVITADAAGNLQNWETRNGVNIKRYRSFAPNDTLYIAPGIQRAVRRADADIVHAHNYHAFPVFFAALGVTHERFVVTPHYHGTSASGVRNRLLAMYKPVGDWVFKQADEVIAVSEWEREQLHDDFGVDTTVIPNGLDVGRFANAEPEERERPYVLCVGRLEEYKGIQYVIRALPELPDYNLVVAGSGHYREELEEISEEIGVADRVDFVGYVDDDRLPRLYVGAEVYVTLSEFEAYGMTVGEAIAAGTPCVVRGEGALEEWTRYTGVKETKSTAPKDVAAVISQSVSTTPDQDLQTWSEVVDGVVRCYHGDAEGNRNKGRSNTLC